MTKGFFSVDLRVFRRAAAGGINQAIACLVMARGTGRDNRTTRWSVNAIEQHTGMSRPNAAKAVAGLLERGVWKRTRAGKHPVYKAVPGDRIPGGPFAPGDLEVLAMIRAGKKVPFKHIRTAQRLAAQGYATRNSSAIFEWNEEAIETLTKPVAVWLPNALVDGAAGEVPPLELLRQTRNLPALRLLIQLYAAQFLPHFGGVPREMIQVEFERAETGRRGPFVVWGFREKCTVASWDLARQFLTGEETKSADGTYADSGWDAVFWPALQTIVDLGLVEKIGMLLDGNDAEAEIIHPYGVRGGELAERDLADAALAAAESMVTANQLGFAKARGLYPRLVPVQRHIVNVALVEIYRLRYRPHTKATAAWYAGMQQTAREYLGRYRCMIKSASGEAIATAAGD